MLVLSPGQSVIFHVGREMIKVAGVFKNLLEEEVGRGRNGDLGNKKNLVVDKQRKTLERF